MMAFAVENTKLEPKNDKRYIRWQANVIQYVDDINFTNTTQLLELCTQDDMTKFNSPDSQETANIVEKQQAAGNLYCLDSKSKSAEIFGSWQRKQNYGWVDVSLVPCASTQEDSCIWEKDEVEKYL